MVNVCIGYINDENLLISSVEDVCSAKVGINRFKVYLCGVKRNYCYHVL